MSVHLTDDQFIERLYGIASGDEHLESCAACQARWNRIRACRDAAASSSPLPAEFFQQQRRQIEKRLAKKTPGFVTMWVPAALALMLMTGFVVNRPKRKPSAPAPRMKVEIVEAGWFADTYSAMRVLEPRATSPIRQLFKEGPVPE
jgi:anti-sigma factor RsiW